MNLKKTIYFVCIITFTFILVACGSNGQIESTNSSPLFSKNSTVSASLSTNSNIITKRDEQALSKTTKTTTQNLIGSDEPHSGISAQQDAVITSDVKVIDDRDKKSTINAYFKLNVSDNDIKIFQYDHKQEQYYYNGVAGEYKDKFFVILKLKATQIENFQNLLNASFYHTIKDFSNEIDVFNTQTGAKLQSTNILNAYHRFETIEIQSDSGTYGYSVRLFAVLEKESDDYNVYLAAW